jgi:hypothetical protein
MYTFCIIFLLLNSCTVINPIRKSPYKTFVANTINKPYDAIVVPGVPYNAPKWNKIMRDRILWSKFLIEKGYANNIIFSGAAVHSPYVESKIMALYAEALGIPKAKIFTEEQAEHSTENIYYSYYVAKKNGFNNVALASDPYQINNLSGYIKKHKFCINLLPILYDTITIMKTKEPLIDPVSAAAGQSFKPLRKRESFFKRLHGTMGGRIKYTEEDKERKKTKCK